MPQEIADTIGVLAILIAYPLFVIGLIVLGITIGVRMNQKMTRKSDQTTTTLPIQSIQGAENTAPTPKQPKHRGQR